MEIILAGGEDNSLAYILNLPKNNQCSGGLRFIHCLLFFNHPKLFLSMDNLTPSQPEASNRNEDPITHEPGAHPVSTGVGALGGGVTGATIGMAIGGPVGSAVGAVIGAVFGGWGGSAVGEAIDPTVEDEYWRAEHSNQPHATGEYPSFEPAYRVGYEGYDKHGGHQRTFEEAEENLRTDYEAGGAALGWQHAREAARAAWTRVHHVRSQPANSETPYGLQTGEPIRISAPDRTVDAGKAQPSHETIAAQAADETVAAQPSHEAIAARAANETIAPQPSNEAIAAQPSDEAIAVRAWCHYEAAGYQDGHDLDHWLRAEREEQQEKRGARNELSDL